MQTIWIAEAICEFMVNQPRVLSFCIESETSLNLCAVSHLCLGGRFAHWAMMRLVDGQINQSDQAMFLIFPWVPQRCNSCTAVGI